MKKIIGLAIAAIMVIAIAGIGTYAYFSDTETSANTFSAGTLNLHIDPGTTGTQVGLDSVTGSIVVSDMEPSDTTVITKTLTVHNTGSIAGTLDLSDVIVSETQGTIESHTNGGSKLADLLNVKVYWNKSGTKTYLFGSDATTVSLSALGNLTTPGTTSIDYAMAAASQADLTLEINWPSTDTDNDAQGNVCTLTFTANLDQATQD